jgi:hypothetical protein
MGRTKIRIHPHVRGKPFGGLAELRDQDGARHSDRADRGEGEGNELLGRNRCDSAANEEADAAAKKARRSERREIMVWVCCSAATAFPAEPQRARAFF